MHVNVNKIRHCDFTRVVLKVLRPVYDHVIVIYQYFKYRDKNMIILVIYLL